MGIAFMQERAKYLFWYLFKFSNKIHRIIRLKIQKKDKNYPQNLKIFMLICSDRLLRNDAYVLSDCYWTPFVNAIDQPVNFTCPHKNVIAGQESIHQNPQQDRRLAN